MVSTREDIFDGLEDVLKGKYEPVGEPNEEHVVEVVKHFLVALEQGTGTIMLLEQANLEYLGTYRALEKSVMLAVEKAEVIKVSCIIINNNNCSCDRMYSYTWTSELPRIAQASKLFCFYTTLFPPHSFFFFFFFKSVYT